MSIIAVHGPNTWGSTSADFSNRTNTEHETVVGAVDAADGLHITFSAVDQSYAAAAYAWSTPGGTPVSGAATKTLSVVYPSAGTYTATLTMSAPAPAAVYTLKVTTISGLRKAVNPESEKSNES